MKPVIWMFSGQGSQYYQMGSELFEHEPVFRQAFERGSAVVQDLVDESLTDVVYKPRTNRFEPFTRTLLTTPAILVVEYAMAQLMVSKGARPDRLLGYSIGEFASFVVAGVLGFEEALAAVVKLAELMEYCTPPATALAVLDSPDALVQHAELFRECETISRAFEKGTLVVCPGAAGPSLRAALKAKGVNFMDLPISHGFHSRLMDATATPVQSVLAALKFSPPQFPLISAASGPVATPDAAHLWEAIRGVVDFRSTIAKLENAGGGRYVDVGPSGTMATLVKHNLGPGSASSFLPILSPFGRSRESLARALQVASS